jgi:pimeloyl-ACP methyl ester carboxylesterase
MKAMAVVLAAASGLSAQEIKTIDVPGSPGQSYALFVPSNYTAERRSPILYCLDPGARGRAAVEHSAAAAQKAGFIVAGSNNSRNGPIEPAQTAVRLMVQDTHARLSIDEDRIYAAGLSGGARLALAWAAHQNSGIAGVIANAAGFGAPDPPKNLAFRIFLTAGVDDPNYGELYLLSRELTRRRVPHRFTEFAGGHEWLSGPTAEEGLAYLSGGLPARPAEPSKEIEQQITEYTRLAPMVESGNRVLLKQLQRDVELREDGAKRRLARRVITGVSISCLERVRELMAAKQRVSAKSRSPFARKTRTDGIRWRSHRPAPEIRSVLSKRWSRQRPRASATGIAPIRSPCWRRLARTRDIRS